MSNLNLKNEWEKWYPEEILLNNPKNSNILWDANIFRETDFYTTKKNKLIDKVIQQNEIKKTDYNDEIFLSNIKKNLEEKKQKYTLLNNKLEELCLNFETSILLFEKTLYSRLLKTILIVASYIVGEKILINEKVLLKKINKIIENNNFIFKKPQLIVHPNNKKILEKLLKQFNNKWELIFNKNIDINSFKILSEHSNIDATIYSRWKEIYRIIIEEEEH